jgi:hypothetical protein
MMHTNTGFYLNPTIQRMASMQLHQVAPTGASAYENPVYQPQLDNMTAGIAVPTPAPHQHLFYVDPAHRSVSLNDMPENVDIAALSQQSLPFSIWQQPFSPGPPVMGVSDTNLYPHALYQVNSSPVALESSPVTGVVSPPWTDRSNELRHSLSPTAGSSQVDRRVEAGISMSPISNQSDPAVSPFGAGFSSSMPSADGNTSAPNGNPLVKRSFKKRACEQCNLSKVKCDSQLPCREYS